MRLAMIGRELPQCDGSAGVSGQIHLLAEAISRAGHQVSVYATNPPAERPHYEYQPIPVPSFVLEHRRLALYLLPFFVSRIPLDGYHIVHAHGEDQFIRTRAPVVRTFHGSEQAEARHSVRLRHRLYHWSMVPLERISERRATAVVVVSRSGQRFLKRSASVIPNAYDPAVFYPHGPRSDRPSILFVGDLRSRKRGELLLHAFATHVRASIPEAELWMVTTDRVEAPGVRWFGRVSRSVLVDLYRRAWLFCMPSSYEGFGVPYLEAMACGTPVVATPNGGSEDVLDHGKAGRIVSEPELGAELTRLLRDDGARQSLSAAGLLRAKEFQVDAIASRYLELYESLLSTRKTPPSASVS